MRTTPSDSSRGFDPFMFLLRQFAQVICVVFVGCATSNAQTVATHWIASWAAAPCGPEKWGAQLQQASLRDRTVRVTVHLSVGGDAVRVKLANTFGKSSLTIAAANIALPLGNGSINPSTLHPLTWQGNPVIQIPVGATITTDPVLLPVHRESDLDVSLYVKEDLVAPAIHYVGLQTSYTAVGNQAAAEQLIEPSKTMWRLIVMGVEVATTTSPYSIGAIGSSTTDGVHSTPNENRRWTDDLFRRLVEKQGEMAPSVVNLGISGNRVLYDAPNPPAGQAATKRFSRDVLSQAGIKYVIAFEGGNDIRLAGIGSIPLSEKVTPEQLIDGFKTMARQSHEQHVKFIVGTITPFEHSVQDRPDDPEWERTRVAFNEWARHTRDVDGVIDFDLAIRDPNHPAAILAKYDSGDHLHPNDAGYQAMADNIDLNLFR